MLLVIARFLAQAALIGCVSSRISIGHCCVQIAHQKGIRGAPGCADGMAIRVTQVIADKKEHPITDAAVRACCVLCLLRLTRSCAFQVGDIWVQPGGGHTGIVRSLTKDKDGKITCVEVEHCSSGQGGVVKSQFKTGTCHR